MVELTLPKDANIFASKYQLYLPSKDELRRKLRDWIAEDNNIALAHNDDDKDDDNDG
jgi:hypothetical protein